ncbi:hypothetical protein BKG70_24170 [Mycobacteroides chelonae]|nr:hypothetical protein BKG67_24375 [Mycobacteroides chelonae]OHT72032.1 hypothetical protein BKG66_11795 [Mycobacteroides chelonae]OHT84525.1 hypothetical protein BKG70_24170 [Mycobacteroides chelonae]
MGLSDLVGPGFFAECMYAVNAAPWDIGGPQPVIRQLVALGAVRGEVLDPGCGTGWHATEFVRRAERGLGVAIREGQDRGEVARRGQGAAVIPPGAKRDRRDKDILLPSNLASKSELQGQTGADGIYAMTDGVSDEMFEEALTEAREEGKLSRSNVARKCKDKAQAAREVVDACR